VLEFSILGHLEHDNVVKCFGRTLSSWPLEDLTEVPATVLTMEYISGGELYEYVKVCGAFEEDVALFLFKQLLEGLDYIHKRSVVHLDLKLDNIFVDGVLDLASSQSWLKIGDFGLSEFVGWPFKEAIQGRKGTTSF